MSFCVSPAGDLTNCQLRNPTYSFPEGVAGASAHSSQKPAEDKVQKRELRLMKNREAARECRRKKKEYVRCLENRVAVLENQNKTLVEELRALKDIYRQKVEWVLQLWWASGTVLICFCGVSWGLCFYTNTLSPHKTLLVLAVKCVYTMMSMFQALNYPCTTTSKNKKPCFRSELSVSDMWNPLQRQNSGGSRERRTYGPPEELRCVTDSDESAASVVEIPKNK